MLDNLSSILLLEEIKGNYAYKNSPKSISAMKITI